MPSLFSLARRPAAAAEKDSDDDSSSGQIAAPLLDEGSAASAPSPLRAAASEAFAVRVKLNGTDHVLPGITPRTTVGELRARVLALHDDANNTNNEDGPRGGQPYLRLIHRGRMMAPDTSRGERYGLSDGDVVHAVLAGGDGAGRSGQQARMLRRMNGDDAGGVGAGSRLSRGTGIDDRGTVVRRDDDDDSESDFEETEGDIELGPQGGQGGGRRRRERRGFDRLRTVRFFLCCAIYVVQRDFLSYFPFFRVTFIPSRAKNLTP